jgi:hypothetical protein
MGWDSCNILDLCKIRGFHGDYEEWMLHRMALARTDVSEELSASIIRGTRIGELGTLLVTANVPCSPILVTLMMDG